MRSLHVVHRFIVYCTPDCLLSPDLELAEPFYAVYVDNFQFLSVCTMFGG